MRRLKWLSKREERRLLLLIQKLVREVRYYEYWLIARITACESRREHFLPANDIRRGTGSSIPRSSLVAIKRFHKYS